eukprot:gene2980-4990_t
MHFQILEIRCEEKENEKEIQDLTNFINKHRKTTKDLAMSYKLAHEKYNKISKELYLKEKKELLHSETINHSPTQLKKRIKNSLERTKRELNSNLTRADDSQSVLMTNRESLKKTIHTKSGTNEKLIESKRKIRNLKEKEYWKQTYILKPTTQTNLIPVIEDGFGIEKGGKIFVNITLSDSDIRNSKLVFIVIPENQYRLISGWTSDPRVLHQICSLPSLIRIPLDKSSIYLSRKIEYSNNYAFLIAKCQQPIEEFYVQVQIQIYNPNESHLSIEDENLINLYFVLLVVYTIILFSHMGYLIINYKGFRRIHVLITIALSLKVIEIISGLAFFMVLSRFGGFVYYILFIREFLGILSETLFLMLLLLTSFGWGLITLYLGRRETQIFWGSLLLFMLFRILYSTCIHMILCPAYVISYKVIKFLINFGIIISLNANIDRLNAVAFEEQWPQGRGSIYSKLEMFKSFRFTFLIYLVLPTIFLFIRLAVLSWKESWVIVGFNEILIVYVLASITYSFRARVFQRSQQQNQGTTENPNNEELEDMNQRTDEELFDEGSYADED